MTGTWPPRSKSTNSPPINFGLFIIALKLLVNDRTKFYSVVIGITFSVFLIVQMTSMFAGILQRSSATVENVGASIWVMDPAVQTVSNTIPLPGYERTASSSRTTPSTRNLDLQKSAPVLR